MAEEIKNLIAKIQKEGIDIAETKARELLTQTQQQVTAILKEAQLKAEKITALAQSQAKQTEESMRSLLNQAARDTLLSLRKEINSLLDKLIDAQVQEALSPEELSKIILSFTKEHAAKTQEQIIIDLAKKDMQKLDGFFAELKKSLKQGITIRPSDDIRAGFVISFDAGKSEFDFSDKALAEYIGLYLKPRLSQILKDAI